MFLAWGFCRGLNMRFGKIAATFLAIALATIVALILIKPG